MHDSAEALRHVGSMLAPVMPSTSRAIWKRLGAAGDPFSHLLGVGREPEWGFAGDADVVHDAGLFPRMDKTSFFADVRSPDTGRSAVSLEKEAGARTEARVGAASLGVGHAEAHGVIGYEDFAKVQLIAGRIRSAKRHPDADKLLVLEVEDGADAPRTICAGIAPYYAPEDLVGKTVAIVANLAPRKLRGIASQGMLLAASYEHDGHAHVKIVELSPDVPPGSEVR
jgi:methionyl-tRNA synthetase